MKYLITIIALITLIIGGAMAEAGPLQETVTCPSEVRGRLGMVTDFTPPSGWGKGGLGYGGYMITMPVVDHWVANNKMGCGYGVSSVKNPNITYSILRITKGIHNGWICKKAPNFSFQCKKYKTINIPKPKVPNIPRLSIPGSK